MSGIACASSSIPIGTPSISTSTACARRARQALRTPRGFGRSALAYFIDGTNTGTLLVDNVKVYNEADYIGAAPAPVFDPRDYGAVGDGTTKDTAAIQLAIDAAAGTGGSVLLTNGTFSERHPDPARAT